jgi:hypothetical protein
MEEPDIEALTPLEALERIELLGPRILVQKVDRSAGLIVLPDEVKQDTGFFKIHAVGQNCLHYTEDDIDGYVHLPIMHNGIRQYGERRMGFFIVTEEAAQFQQDFGVYTFDEGEL